MFSWKEFENTKTVLSQVKSYQDQAGQHHVTIRPVDLQRWMEVACEDLGFLMLVEMAGVDLTGVPYNTHRFELTYHLLNMETHQRFNIHVLVDESEVVPSVVNFYPHADWLEREQHEALGIQFSRPLHGLLLPHDQKFFPLRKNAQINQWPVEKELTAPQLRKNPNKSEAPFPEESWQWKSFGLFSPLTRGDFEWLVCFDPVKVVDSKVNIGFAHQGFEKLLETKDWLQVLQLVEKINLGAAPNYGIAWSKTLEDLLRIKIPERAQAIRIVALELARIAEHLTVIHDMTFALEMPEHRLFINAREKIYELIEKYCGRRQGLGLTRIGGVKEDLPHGWIVEYQAICEMVKKNLKAIHRSLFSQNKFRKNLGAGQVSAQTALQWGITGPAMRACGLNFDLRKSQPFYFYQDIDFDIPVGIHGTAYDRYLIRLEEIYQSFRIITQVIDNLPLGSIVSQELDLDYTGLKDYLSQSEIPRAWHYTGLESPNGEAGFLVKFNDNTTPYRVKIKTPSFPLVQALPSFVLGLQEHQLKSCLASLGIRRFELDR
jgi:NADH-quinone oxidoreductase subunit C/D